MMLCYRRRSPHKEKKKRKTVINISEVLLDGKLSNGYLQCDLTVNKLEKIKIDNERMSIIDEDRMNTNVCQRIPSIRKLVKTVLIFTLLALTTAINPSAAPTSARSTNYKIDLFAGTGNAPNSSPTSTPATSANFDTPRSVWGDSLGYIYIAENSGCWVRKIDLSGNWVPFAGTATCSSTVVDGLPATSSQLFNPYSIMGDTTGVTYIVDRSQGRVRMVTTTGLMNTVAGHGMATDSGNGGPATSAFLLGPIGLFLDTNNQIYICSASGNLVRIVTSGIINGFAGTTSGNTGDGGPATSAQLNTPERITGDTTGRIYISDTGK